MKTICFNKEMKTNAIENHFKGLSTRVLKLCPIFEKRLIQ